MILHFKEIDRLTLSSANELDEEQRGGSAAQVVPVDFIAIKLVKNESPERFLPSFQVFIVT